MSDLTTLQFFLAAIAACSGLMIVLQLIVRRGVWGFYLIAFFASAVWLAWTLR